jgi:hypothetical protein
MNVEGQEENLAQRFTQESPQKPLSQENQKNSSISNRSRSISTKERKTDNIGESINHNDSKDKLPPSGG